MVTNVTAFKNIATKLYHVIHLLIKCFIMWMQKRLLSLYDAESERNKFGSLHAGNSESAIPSA